MPTAGGSRAGGAGATRPRSPRTAGWQRRGRESGQAKVGGVGLDHDDRRTEALPEGTGSLWVPFHCDHLRARSEKRNSERAEAGADVDDQVTRANAGRIDQALRPDGVDLMPPPPR